MEGYNQYITNFKIFILFLCLGLLSVSSCASESDKQHPYLDVERLSKYAEAVETNGAYAKVISKAIEHFSDSGFRQFPLNNYLILVAEIEDCYFVQIGIPTTKKGTGTPFYYCIDKISFRVSEATNENFRLIDSRE